MNDPLANSTPPSKGAGTSELTTELLILPDGRILVHNLTQPFAELLRELNPNEEQISLRTNKISPHAKGAKVASEIPAFRTLRTLREEKKSETGATPVLHRHEFPD